MKVFLLVFCLMFISSSAFCFEPKNPFNGAYVQHSHKALKKKKLKVTAYTASKKENGGHSLTANNTKLKHGYVAVSRDLLKSGWKFGDKIYIETLGIFEIQDTMAPWMKNTIDVFMHKKHDANEWGVQNLEVTLLTKN